MPLPLGDVRDGGNHGAQLLELVEPARRRVHRFALVVAHGRHDEHVRTVVLRRDVEELARVLAQHDRRKRPERLAKLDLQVHHRLHVRRARVADNRAVAQRTRPELHPALKQAHHLLSGDQAGNLIGEQ